MSRMITHVLYLLLAISVATTAQATDLTDIPQESGFSGFINVGGAYGRVKSNLVADFGQERTDTLTGSPDGQSIGTPLLIGNLRYTLVNSRTQIFLGNNMEDFVRYDITNQIGVRQEIGRAGIIGVSGLFSGFATQVWKDPYVTGQNRQETDRTSTGARIAWNKIFGSNLHLQFSQRKFELDNENSGNFLGLTQAQQALLNREGDQRVLKATYVFDINQRHIIVPAVISSEFDLDGKSMSHDQKGVKLTYTYRGDPIIWIANIAYSQSDYDEVNPIFGIKADAEDVEVSLRGLYRSPFGWKKWSLMGSVGFYESNSDIDFYDGEVTVASLSMFRRF